MEHKERRLNVIVNDMHEITHDKVIWLNNFVQIR